MEEDTELPVSSGYDDEGLDALYELAAGDVVRVETDTDTFDAEVGAEPAFGRERHGVLWSRIVEASGERMGLAVITGDGTFLFTEAGRDGFESPVAVEGLELVEAGDAVLCELHAVHYPDGASGTGERTEFIRATDIEAAREQYEERYGAVDYFAAAYEDVDMALGINAEEEGLTGGN